MTPNTMFHHKIFDDLMIDFEGPFHIYIGFCNLYWQLIIITSFGSCLNSILNFIIKKYVLKYKDNILINGLVKK